MFVGARTLYLRTPLAGPVGETLTKTQQQGEKNVGEGEDEMLGERRRGRVEEMCWPERLPFQCKVLINSATSHRNLILTYGMLQLTFWLRSEPKALPHSSSPSSLVSSKGAGMALATLKEFVLWHVWPVP